MEEFILRIVGILCATIIACTIVIARKDDIDIWSVVIAGILEILALAIIFFPKDLIIELFSNII